MVGAISSSLSAFILGFFFQTAELFLLANPSMSFSSSFTEDSSSADGQYFIYINIIHSKCIHKSLFLWRLYSRNFVSLQEISTYDSKWKFMFFCLVVALIVFSIQ